MEELQEKYKKLFSLYDPEHCIEFREIIRRLSKSHLDQEVLVEALGNEHYSPSKESNAAAIMLVYHFLYDLEHRTLFRLLDCCITKEDERKVKKRVWSIDVEHFDKDFFTSLAGKPFKQSSIRLANELLEELEWRAYQKKVEKVLALF